ncbi:hypothetical protein [Amphritea pacifica]|uniref:hypothetical protein n=1 Tax=Amphritea pacifica TaxID=2811233 RepID=UPI001962BB39|nr:hypothetical protein [Amphritea pacifica]MBN1009200.1 hypothetical protein [Amphritea pacifica]
MKRIFAITSIFGLIFSSALILFLKKTPSEAMEVLKIGSSYSELLDIAGEPSYETDGTAWVEPDFKKTEDQIIPGCVKEVWYESKVKIAPSKFSFCFDSEEKLIHKYHWTSW